MSRWILLRRNVTLLLWLVADFVLENADTFLLSLRFLCSKFLFEDSKSSIFFFFLFKVLKGRKGGSFAAVLCVAEES